MLSVMLSVVIYFPDYQFVIAGAPSIEMEFYQQITGSSNIKIVQGKTYALLQNSYAALVTSGTATLETALFDVPEVVCYKGSFISYQIAKRVVDKSIIKFISLVNLIMDKEVVKELIQNDLNRVKLKAELKKITDNQSYRENVMADYKTLKQKLGGKGASKKTAKSIIRFMVD
jgi:lipid-A-disaccharide synthase